MLSDVQASRLLTRDTSHNIHLTIIGVTRQQRLQTCTSNITDSSSDSTLMNQESSMASLVNTMNEDTKPVKMETSTDNLIPIDIFGDAYADLISMPKLEPDTLTLINASTETQLSNLLISDVHTIGTAIKDKPLENTTIIAVDPYCKLHGTNATKTTHTLQEATTWEPVVETETDSMLPISVNNHYQRQHFPV